MMSAGPKLTVGQHSVAGRKEPNEDFYGILVPDPPFIETKGIAMAISDGMSGTGLGKVASESCLKSFFTDYFCTHESWSVKTSVARVLTATNRWLYAQGQSPDPARGGMVCTFSALILKGGRAYIFHVGDSRIYRLREGALEPLTQDHRAQLMGGRLALSRAMGVAVGVEIDCRTEPVEAGDVLIFTTDGVHDYLPDSEIARILVDSGCDLDAAAASITSTAHDRGSLDNLTCQIVRVDDLGTSEASAHYERLQERPFPPDLVPGMKIDGYRVVRELHASNRSQIYLAVDESTDKTVILKTPSVNFEDDAHYLEAFTREEWIATRLDSPHVVTCVKPVRRRQFLYYVTEYLEGQTLRQWMYDHPDPDLSVVRQIIEQIAVGLRAFHRLEMIHQDIKPENIIIDRHGTVKIVDFGSVRVTGLDEAPSPHDPSNIQGTLGYAAPEYQLGSAGSPRSDLYSLGVIAYEMLTGKLPYGAGFSSTRSVTNLSFTAATKHKPDMPAWMAAALAKAVHRDPIQRYEALSEFVTDLSSPNPKFTRSGSPPLIERDPVKFWQGIAIILMGIIIALLLGKA